ncbi:MAG: histidine kinase [Rhodospirillaceae bacterium]|nr:histidine kinase [Rhodospirillaceae bacterium]|tara:strand:+ start:793 stop:1923 length:1131 start_codon:yes stop_codon:yes gene_type:complete
MNSGTPFLSAHASASDWQVAAGEIVRQFDSVTPAHRLGFLYVTDHFSAYLEEISIFLRDTLGVPHWAGTVGFGVCTTAQEYFDAPAMVVMLAPVSEDSFRIFKGVSEDITSITETHKEWLSGPFPPLTVVHGDPRNHRVSELISEISNATEGFLVGGLTAATENFVQIADNATDGGLSGVMFSSGQVTVQAGLTQGCSPIGDTHQVTAADENMLIELDGRPALDVFKEDIGDVLAHDLQRVGGYIFAALPVTGTDTGDYLVRNLVGIDPESGVVAVGEYVSAGDRIMFCRRDHDSAVTDMQRMLVDIKKRTNNSLVRGGLYFSCCARGPNQFGDDSDELKMITKELGEFPLVGFFANGEISNNRLYGYTGVLTVFL